MLRAGQMVLRGDRAKIAGKIVEALTTPKESAGTAQLRGIPPFSGPGRGGGNIGICVLHRCPGAPVMIGRRVPQEKVDRDLHQLFDLRHVFTRQNTAMIASSMRVRRARPAPHAHHFVALPRDHCPSAHLRGNSIIRHPLARNRRGRKYLGFYPPRLSAHRWK